MMAVRISTAVCQESSGDARTCRCDRHGSPLKPYILI